MNKHLLGLLVVSGLGLHTTTAIADDTPAPSTTGLISCTTPNSALGTGIVISKSCSVATPTNVNFPDYYDAYYSIRATTRTGPAFSRVGARLDPSAGKVLGRIVEKLFGIGRGKSLSIGWKAKLGGQEYPVQSLVSFSHADNGDWTVSTNAMSETLLHRMTAVPGAEVSLVYLYSDRADVDLNHGRELIGSAVPWLAGSAATPIFTIAGKVTSAIYDSNSIKGKNSPGYTLKPSVGDPVLVQFDIKDPYEKNADQAQLIASITIELRGTRSLLRDEATFDQLANTLPRDGALDAPRMGQLASYMFLGSPSKWPAVYTALAGMGSTAPFGAALKEADIDSFCRSADKAINDNFPLSYDDANLLKASMLQTASVSIKDKVNPFVVCFDGPTRAMIKAKLNVDTDYAPKLPPPSEITGFKSKQLLRVAAAWFVSKSCSDEDITNSPLGDYVADKIEIGPRDDLPAGNGIKTLVVPAPPDNTVTRAVFLKATCGAFPFWNTLSDSTGTFQVDQVKSNAGWRVTGSLSAGKIASFSIVKL